MKLIKIMKNKQKQYNIIRNKYTTDGKCESNSGINIRNKEHARKLKMSESQTLSSVRQTAESGIVFSNFISPNIRMVLQTFGNLNSY